MKKVLLLGDSIRLSYQARVRELLAGQAEVTGPEENCRFSSYTLFCLATWLTDDYDVIHWNNGQWDVCYMPDGQLHTPPDRYVELQLRIAAVLRKAANQLVFATTTPVRRAQYTSAVRNGRKNEDIATYNAAATRRLASEGIVVNDLFTALSEDVERYIGEDKVHLSDAGIERCAQRVAAAVRSVL